MKKHFNETATQAQTMCPKCKKAFDKGHVCPKPTTRRTVGI